MLGRRNITVFFDELERVVGGIWQLMAKEGMTGEEMAYWTGAANALNLLRSDSIGGDWEQFVAALKMHFEGVA